MQADDEQLGEQAATSGDRDPKGQLIGGNRIDGGGETVQQAGNPGLPPLVATPGYGGTHKDHRTQQPYAGRKGSGMDASARKSKVLVNYAGSETDGTYQDDSRTGPPGEQGGV